MKEDMLKFEKKTQMEHDNLKKRLKEAVRMLKMQ